MGSVRTSGGSKIPRWWQIWFPLADAALVSFLHTCTSPCPRHWINLGTAVAPSLTYFSKPTLRSADVWGLPLLHFEAEAPLHSCHLRWVLFPHIPTARKAHQQVCCFRRVYSQGTKCLFTFLFKWFTRAPLPHTLDLREGMPVHPLPKWLSSSLAKSPGRWGQPWVVGPVLQLWASQWALREGSWPQLLVTINLG